MVCTGQSVTPSVTHTVIMYNVLGCAEKSYTAHDVQTRKAA
jgi:hypothetical protein